MDHTSDLDLSDIDFNENDIHMQTSILIPSDIEQNEAGDERSTLSNSKYDFLSSSDDDDGDMSEAKAHHKRAAKHPLFIKRNIAEGVTFNNSFTGPYPEETDHLHIDKGANPQFEFLRTKL